MGGTLQPRNGFSRVVTRQTQRKAAVRRFFGGDGMAEWQPIETAPRDGTPILLWPGKESWTERMMPVAGWFALGSIKWVSHSDWMAPTHWQPLPAPPEATNDR